MIFFVGLHQPSDAKYFDAAFISVNRLRKRKSNFAAGDWIMDSGAFSEISKHGRYRHSVEEYVAQIERWRTCGNLLAVVTQDWMCEPWIVRLTGLSVTEHQRLTIDRYDAIQALTTCLIIPVLQGFTVDDYLRHLDAYGDRLKQGTWVGVGSICKRNADVRQIEDILEAIKEKRPDLRLHGFGLKTTALASSIVWDLLHTADSMAWSFAARRQKLGANDWRNAKRFEERVNTQHRGYKPRQRELF